MTTARAAARSNRGNEGALLVYRDQIRVVAKTVGQHGVAAIDRDRAPPGDSSAG